MQQRTVFIDLQDQLILKINKYFSFLHLVGLDFITLSEIKEFQFFLEICPRKRQAFQSQNVWQCIIVPPV
jgi:hypothetical protein